MYAHPSMRCIPRVPTASTTTIRMIEKNARRRNLRSPTGRVVLVLTFRPPPKSEIRGEIVVLDEPLLVCLYVTPEDVGLAVVEVPGRDKHHVIFSNPDAPLHLTPDSAEAHLAIDALHDYVVAALDLGDPSQ